MRLAIRAQDPSSPTDSRRAAVAVLLLAVMLVASNVFWLQRDRRPPNCDTAHHFAKSYAFYTILRDARSPLSLVRGWLAFNTHFPPLAYVGSAAAFRLFGFSTRVGVEWLLLFWPILIFYTWRLGAWLGSEETGVLAALVASTYPLLLMIGRKFLMEFPLAALFAAGLFHLLASDGFRRRGHALAFGAWLAAGMLYKWTILLYLGGAGALAAGSALAQALRGGWTSRLAVVYTLLQGWALYLLLEPCVPSRLALKAGEVAIYLLAVAAFALGLWLIVSLVGWIHPDQALASWLNLLRGAALWWVMASPWFLVHARALARYYPQITRWAGAREGDPAPGTLTDHLFYAWAIKATQFQGCYYLLLIGLAAAVVRVAWRRERRLVPLLATFLVFYVVATHVQNKEARYYVPLAPVLALLTVFWIPSLGRGRWLVTVPLAGICLLQLWCWTLYPVLPLRMRNYFAVDDNLPASALLLPGNPALEGGPTPSGQALAGYNFRTVRITWEDLIRWQPSPVFGALPRQEKWDERSVIGAPGP